MAHGLVGVYSAGSQPSCVLVRGYAELLGRILADLKQTYNLDIGTSELRELGTGGFRSETSRNEPVQITIMPFYPETVCCNQASVTQCLNS